MNFLEKLLPVEALVGTVKRFSASSLCSVALLLVALLLNHDVLEADDQTTFWIVTILVCWFFWFGFVQLAVEGAGLGAWFERGVGVCGLAFFACLVVLSSGINLVWFLALITPALFLGISVAPYIKGRDDLSFWFYNRQLWGGVAISIFVGMLWFVGIVGALFAVKSLFEVPIPNKIWFDIYAFAAIVFTPLYALSWVPSRYVYTEKDCHAPPQLAFVLNWVLAPLVVVYMVILYAYFGKIALAGDMPKGQLSYMVCAFGGVGVLTYMAGWSLRDSGGVLLRFVVRWFFPALIIPVLVQMVSIAMRVEQYGFTEQRYLVVLSALWMAGLAVAYSFKRKPGLKWICCSLAVLLLCVSFGPMSASNVAQRIQFERLETILMENGILVDGKIRAAADVPFEARKDISSILDFLSARETLGVIRPWLGDGPAAVLLTQEGRYRDRDPLTQAMGFSFVRSYDRRRGEQAQNFNLNADRKRAKVLDVEGYRFFVDAGHVNLYRALQREDSAEKPLWRFKDDDATSLDIYYWADLLYVGLKGRDAIGFDVEAYALEEMRRDPSKTRRDLVMEDEVRGLRVKLIFSNINLRRDVKDDGRMTPYVLNGFNFKALVD